MISLIFTEQFLIKCSEENSAHLFPQTFINYKKNKIKNKWELIGFDQGDFCPGITSNKSENRLLGVLSTTVNQYLFSGKTGDEWLINVYINMIEEWMVFFVIDSNLHITYHTCANEHHSK